MVFRSQPAKVDLVASPSCSLEASNAEVTLVSPAGRQSRIADAGLSKALRVGTESRNGRCESTISPARRLVCASRSALLRALPAALKTSSSRSALEVESK